MTDVELDERVTVLEGNVANQNGSVNLNLQIS